MASKLLLASAFTYLLNRDTSRTSELAEGVLQRKAICLLDSQPNETAKGVVNFSQAGAFALCEINATLTGLAPSKKHGFHIHQYGNLSQGCVTAGPHYNPFGHTHSGPKSVARHVGDLGNVESDAEGKATYHLLDHQVNLYGPYSVVGRSVVLHRGEDDLGLGGNEESLKTGNAGARIACGVIGLAME
ncbi:hypothetical protein FGO68_gene12126 [Halteria grandinella]|uniref:Superoxide dismutase [Cu-Zn] n=1 Tax=Halteria grandinella TaxID=5974 RepID=A0A8J8SYC5_HALGN|nr:hypothetical protein FGO68_gene12126 [Halteria grandinella]